MTGTEYVWKGDVIQAVKWDGEPGTANAFIGEGYGVDWEYEGSGSSDILVSVPAGWLRVRKGDWIARLDDGTLSVIEEQEFGEFVELNPKPAADSNDPSAASFVAVFFDKWRQADPVGLFRILKAGLPLNELEKYPSDTVTAGGGRLTLLALLNILLRRLGDEVLVIDVPPSADGKPLPIVSAVYASDSRKFELVEAASGEAK